MNGASAGNSWTPPAGPFTRQGSKLLRGDGQQFCIAMSANEADWMLGLLNAAALNSTATRPTDGVREAEFIASASLYWPPSMSMRERTEAVSELLSRHCNQAGFAGVIRAALDAQPSTAEDPNEDAYQRGRFDGIMEYAKAILALTPPSTDTEAMVEKVARAMIAPEIEEHVSQIQGFLYGVYHVIRDCTKEPASQELSRTIFQGEHDERYELERAKVVARAAIAAIGSAS